MSWSSGGDESWEQGCGRCEKWIMRWALGPCMSQRRHRDLRPGDSQNAIFYEKLGSDWKELLVWMCKKLTALWRGQESVWRGLILIFLAFDLLPSLLHKGSSPSSQRASSFVFFPDLVPLKSIDTDSMVSQLCLRPAGSQWPQVILQRPNCGVVMGHLTSKSHSSTIAFWVTKQQC